MFSHRHLLTCEGMTAKEITALLDIADKAAALEAILDAHGALRAEQVSRVRANAMACPAKPTCGLAMTDAENVLPHAIGKGLFPAHAGLNR